MEFAEKTAAEATADEQKQEPKTEQKQTSSPDLAKSISMYILQQFYLLPYDTSRDFYSQYEARMAAAKEWSENL